MSEAWQFISLFLDAVGRALYLALPEILVLPGIVIGVILLGGLASTVINHR